MRRRSRRWAPALAALALAAGGAATGSAQPASVVVRGAATPPAAVDALRCVAPTDGAAIDAVLREAGSPLAGDGATIVAEGVAAGIDPRALVAIAAHETMLMTYGPAAAMRNPFGLGPGMRFATSADADRYAARLLERWYLTQGRTTLPLIGSKWAPVGVANDPQGLNENWTAGVSRFYRMLGGDPYRPILLAVQGTTVDCAAAEELGRVERAEDLPAGSGPSVVVLWGGATPVVAGRRARDGADPASGLPAAVSPFAFPVAVPEGGGVRYGAARCPAGGLCVVDVRTAPGAHVVAATDGRLVAAAAAERAAGIAFWIVRHDGDRLGYGPLAGYETGIRHGGAVTAGTPLGRSVGTVAVAWTRGGTPIDPHPLLTATRPSDPA